ncbi:MAG: hypothetical protein ACRD29_20630, partial [Acidimicrobiales bacterium]
MARADGTDDVLRRADEVVAAAALPGVPEGTRGRVVVAEGLTWIRYWVRFENGVVRGTIHRRKLARPQEWNDILERRARGADEDEPAPEAMAAADAGA